VDADHAPRVLAVAAGFRAEARAVRRELERQRLRIDDLVGDEVRDRVLRGRDEEEIAALDLEEVLAELGEAGRRVGRFAFTMYGTYTSV
jgi:hypothetical protein